MHREVKTLAQGHREQKNQGLNVSNPSVFKLHIQLLGIGHFRPGNTYYIVFSKDILVLFLPKQNEEGLSHPTITIPI